MSKIDPILLSVYARSFKAITDLISLSILSISAFWLSGSDGKPECTNLMTPFLSIM